MAKLSLEPADPVAGLSLGRQAQSHPKAMVQTSRTALAKPLIDA